MEGLPEDGGLIFCEDSAGNCGDNNVIVKYS